MKRWGVTHLLLWRSICLAGVRTAMIRSTRTHGDHTWQLYTVGTQRTLTSGTLQRDPKTKVSPFILESEFYLMLMLGDEIGSRRGSISG